MRSFFLLFLLPLFARSVPLVQSDYQEPQALQSQRIQRLMNGLKGRAASGDVSAHGEWIIGEIKKAGSDFESQIPVARAFMEQGRTEAVKNLIRTANSNPEYLDIDLLMEWRKNVAYFEKVPAPQMKALDESLEMLKKKRLDLLQAQKSLCGSDLDLSSGFPPIRDQTDTDWCYAFVMADLLSYKMKTPVSAADIAIEYDKTFAAEWKTSTSPLPFESVHRPGGDMVRAFGLVQRKGACLEKDFPSEALSSSNSQKHQNYKTLVNEIENFQFASGQYTAVQKPYCSDIFNRVGSKVFPNVSAKEFEQIFQSAKTNELIHILGQNTCKNSRLSLANTKLQCPFGNEKDHSKMIEDMLKRLDGGSPIGVLLNEDALDPKYRVPGLSTLPTHTVILTGKRWNKEKNRCELQTRNSWGSKLATEWVPLQDLAGATSQACSLK